MDRRRAGWAVAALLIAGVASAATQGPPAYVYTGAAPSGACVGTRVWIDALGSGTYYCNAGTWALASAGGAVPGGSPGTIQINSAGSFGGYGGTSCAAPNFIRSLSASGAATCSAPAATGSANYTAVLLDFGASESDDVASTTVTGQTWVTGNSRIMCAPTMHATSSRAEGAEDAAVEGLTVAVHSRVVGTGFTVTAAAREGTTGVYQVVCSGSDDWSTLVASIAPATEGCGCTGVGTCGCNTGYATCSATGGTGAYTYSWTVDDGTVSISNSTSATSRFGATGAIPGSISPTATCTVSDGVSTSTKTLPLTITFDSI